MKFSIIEVHVFCKQLLFDFLLSISMPFVSFPGVVALIRTFSIVLNKSSESGHLYLILDLKKKLSTFFVQYANCYTYGLYYEDSITLRHVPSIPNLVMFFF